MREGPIHYANFNTVMHLNMHISLSYESSVIELVKNKSAMDLIMMHIFNSIILFFAGSLIIL